MIDPPLFQKVMLLFVTFTDRYEVLFFDGFTKNIKGIRMSKLEGDADGMAEVRSDVLDFSFMYCRLDHLPLAGDIFHGTRQGPVE
jgi:hypothetical protein